MFLRMILIIPAQITVRVSSACLLKCLKSLVHPTNFRCEARHGRLLPILLAVTWNAGGRVPRQCIFACHAPLCFTTARVGVGMLEMFSASVQLKTEERIWQTSPGSPTSFRTMASKMEPRCRKSSREINTPGEAQKTCAFKTTEWTKALQQNQRVWSPTEFSSW